MSRACLLAGSIVVACGLAAGTGFEARGGELVASPTLDPLARPAPELPMKALSAPKSVNTLRIEISEEGLLDVASTGVGEDKASCEAAFITQLRAPFVSSFAPLPFVTAVEIGPGDARVSMTQNRKRALSASELAGLAWRLELVTHSSLGIDLGGDPLRLEQAVELPLKISWGGLSLGTTPLDLEWLPGTGPEVCWPAQSLELTYGASGALPLLQISGRASLYSPTPDLDHPDWKAELDVNVPAGTGYCSIRPQAIFTLGEAERQVQGSLRAGVEVGQELRAGHCVDLVLEYFATAFVNGDSGAAAALQEQAILFRLIF